MTPRRTAPGLLLALCALATGAAADDAAPVRLRYSWAPGQTWRATHSLERELEVAGAAQQERGVARFEYRVRDDVDAHGALRLEARMLSQETAAGVSPLDFSAVLFRTRIDQQGRQQGSYYAVGDAEPPAIAGVDSDPIAYRRMLRQVASGWRHAVFWFPELPEKELSPGGSFVVKEERDLGGSEDPDISMLIQSTRTYRLLAVEGGVARFRVEDVSSVDADGAEGGIASEERAEGEARFDLGLGMWTQQQLVSSQRARYSGAAGGAGAGEGETRARSVNTIEMQRVSDEPR